MGYEFLEHTADIRVACHASDMPSLLEVAGEALYAVALRQRCERKDVRRNVSLEVASHEELVVRWLQELLFLLETEQFVMADVQWSMNQDWVAMPLTVEASIEGYVCKREDRVEEIKAVTYHGLEVTVTDEGYRAEIVFDV